MYEYMYFVLYVYIYAHLVQYRSFENTEKNLYYFENKLFIEY